MANNLTPVSDEALGKGIVFPFTFDSSGRVPIVGGFDLIRASIITILSWPFGFRYFLAEFGSKAEELLEEPNDPFLKSMAMKYIVEAISRWEHRVEQLEAAIIEQEGASMNIQIKYKLKSTKTEDSFIYPFYTNINL